MKIIPLMSIACKLMISSALVSGSSLAKVQSFMPSNQLHLDDRRSLTNANIDELSFRAAIDKALEVYSPLAEQMGARLEIHGNWQDSTVNAFASQNGSDVWVVEMFGGLARRPEVTLDGFKLVLCHELGHHFGGYPFYSDQDWAASEGQSDYYATQVCARKIWGDEFAENARFRSRVSLKVRSACNLVWESRAQQDLCYRSMVAGESLALLLSNLSADRVLPSYETPATYVVEQTDPSHPKGQCRLDTYASGALCDIERSENIIPGSQMELRNSVQAEISANMVSCSRTNRGIGRRPRCWFSPKEKVTVDRVTVGGSESAYSIMPGHSAEIRIWAKNNFQSSLDGVYGQFVMNESTPLAFGGMNANAVIRAEEDFVVSVPLGASCGDRMPFEVKLRSEFGAEAPYQGEILVGNFTDREPYEEQVQVMIPDADFTGIKRTFQFSGQGQISGLKGEVTVSHSWPEDLELVLLPPEGQEAVTVQRALIRNKDDHDHGHDHAIQADEFEYTFEWEVEFAPRSMEGVWTLWVRDLAVADEGQLKSFRITPRKLVCE